MAGETEKNFYREIDDLALRPSLSCTKLAIVFVIIAIFLGSGLFWTIGKFKHGSGSFAVKSFVSQEQPTETGKTSITVTDSDLATVFAANNGRLPLELVTTSISTEGIAVKGVLTNIRLRAAFIVVPRVVNHEITVTTKHVTLGRFGAPPWFAGQISSIINRELQTRISPDDRKRVESIELQSGQFVITINPTL